MEESTIVDIYGYLIYLLPCKDQGVTCGGYSSESEQWIPWRDSWPSSGRDKKQISTRHPILAEAMRRRLRNSREWTQFFSMWGVSGPVPKGRLTLCMGKSNAVVSWIRVGHGGRQEWRGPPGAWAEVAE